MTKETNNQSPDTVNSSKQLGLRKFSPMVLQTKEELIQALDQGRLESSKYNLLNEREKRFVQLVCFAGYTAEQAIHVIIPGVKNTTLIANRLMSNKAVMDTIEELSVARDRKFAAEISSARDMALEKLKFILATTDDPALAASCAKIILDKSEFYTKQADKKDDEPVGGVKFSIRVDNVNVSGAPSPKENEPVIIELTPQEINRAVGKDVVDEDTGQVYEGASAEINPETGLPYVIKYEGIDNYNDNEN